ncbi:MAG: response regulator [Chloroflexi bacterium]|nr:response regulator [Chloroflexota bacterium]
MESQTILLIDDDEMISSMFAQYLARAGYKTVIAHNGPTGVEKYRAENPDLVVLDVAMPEVSGFEVAKQIREVQQEENRAHTPLIILTAYARSFFLSVSSDIGIDSFLNKPIAPDDLLEHINQFLGNAPA